MPFKTRSESKEMKILRFLNTRMNLPTDAKQRYLNLKKGYEGEVLFDSLTAALNQKFYILNDLLLENNHTTFQIDSLLITQKFIILCEVKNFEGDYYYELDDFHLCSTKTTITNPLHQLKRCETLLRQLLQKHGFHFHIESYLNFINPEFYLYQAPINEKIIFRPQFNRFLHDISMKPSNLNGWHRKLADFLLQAHLADPPIKKIPAYEYDWLKKGITCGSCCSYSISVGEKTLICNECGLEEKIETSVVRSIEELKLLFPEKRITASLVYDWCKAAEIERKIRRILAKNYKMVGQNRYAYYINNDNV